MISELIKILKKHNFYFLGLLFVALMPLYWIEESIRFNPAKFYPIFLGVLSLSAIFSIFAVALKNAFVKQLKLQKTIVHIEQINRLINGLALHLDSRNVVNYKQTWDRFLLEIETLFPALSVHHKLSILGKIEMIENLHYPILNGVRNPEEHAKAKGLLMEIKTTLGELIR